MSLVFRDAFWQIFGRLISAIAGFFVVKLITPYLGPLRYGDYSTVLKYFAIWSALADFGIYVVALNILGKKSKQDRVNQYHKFLGFRFFMVIVVYLTAFCVAWLIPSYSSNPYISYGLIIGMLFSALFMLAGILQIPLQLYWKMKHVSIALILARLTQILVLVSIVYYFAPNVDFSKFSLFSLLSFLGILSSVLISGLVQFLYVLFVGNKYLKFKVHFDFAFIKENLKINWPYGVSYFLSSFHTLIVLIFLSIMFPTSNGFNYVGIWAVALALIEILLIVPSAFGNSIIHKISSYDRNKKLKSLGYYLTFILWFGMLVLFNFLMFRKQIVFLIAGKKYLTTYHNIGSDFILPYLSFVLFLSFIKQVFNYVLVSFNKQNYLFKINLVGVFFGIIIGLYTIPRMGLYGGIITQIFLELCFVLGVLLVAHKNEIFPKLDIKLLTKAYLAFFCFFLLCYYSFNKFNLYHLIENKIYFVFVVMIINTVFLAFSFNFIKKVMNNI